MARDDLAARLGAALRSACGDGFAGTPDHGLALAVREPETVGADRFFAARGAVECVGRACLVLDAGTALTVDAVSADPWTFEGGAIAPGPALLAKALATGGARLPEVGARPGSRALGRDTAEALEAGVVVGFRGAARELVRGVGDESGVGARTLVLTGGARAFLLDPLLFDPADVHEIDELVHVGLHAALTSPDAVGPRCGAAVDPARARAHAAGSGGRLRGRAARARRGGPARGPLPGAGGGPGLPAARERDRRRRAPGRGFGPGAATRSWWSCTCTAARPWWRGCSSTWGRPSPGRRPPGRSGHASCWRGRRARRGPDPAGPGGGGLERGAGAAGGAGAAPQQRGLEQLAERGRVARYALEPARVALAGPVNAGKSTLFNALFGTRRVIVSEVEGTTRDTIFERVRLGPWPVDLCDGPGARPASEAEELERSGQALLARVQREADLVLWLAPAPDPARSAPRDLDERTVVVTSRADLLTGESPWPALCARDDPAGAVAVVTRGRSLEAGPARAAVAIRRRRALRPRDPPQGRPAPGGARPAAPGGAGAPPGGPPALNGSGPSDILPPSEGQEIRAPSSAPCPPNMKPGIRHLVSIDDLSLAEVLALFEHAEAFSKNLRGWAHLCPGLIAASLFFEASTRTRLSFESAMLRLGGGVISAAEMKTSSAAKGESLADTVRVVGSSYADVIVLRHASEGAARLAAEYSPVPIVNGGDGSHEHPTQTLCDLYNLWLERGQIEGLNVVLSGDLRYSRTIHSFVYALARFGANIVCVPQPGFELPGYVVQRLREEFGVEPVRADVSRLGSLAEESDAVYLTPQKPHQLSLFTGKESRVLPVERVDALYMTRPQTERFAEEELDETKYVHLDKRRMAAESLRNAVVMHPLPRRDEISEDIDADPRSIYFKQAGRGVPIRMAILGYLLGRLEIDSPARDVDVRLHPVTAGDNPCSNPSCISHTEPRHVKPLFKLASRYPVRAYCGYCSQELAAPFVGCTTTRHFHARDAASARKIRPDHLVFFRSEAHATSEGFTPVARPSAVPAPGSPS